MRSSLKVNAIIKLTAHNYIFLSVPSPDVEVIVPHQEPYLAGMFAELRCSISLDDSVDTQVDIVVLWLKDGVELNETVRVRVLPTRLIGSSLYHSLLQFSTLSSSSDGGDYTCTTTVFPTESRDYITNGTGTASLSFTLTGYIHNYVSKWLSVRQESSSLCYYL